MLLSRMNAPRALLASLTVMFCLGVVGMLNQAHGETITDSFGGRTLLVTLPASASGAGSRALVIVLHGGLGNAQRIASRQSEGGLNLDAAADRDGFVVAYLNGTRATRFLGEDKLAWNSGGGCCGVPAESNVDDVSYIRGAVAYLVERYHIDRARVFAFGHSNGAMMAQRMMCETDLFTAAVAVSGPLDTGAERCPSARGKRILAIHGADDENVPIVGGHGTKGVAKVSFTSEAHAKEVFLNSGASYELQIIPGADHPIDHISAVIERTEGIPIGKKAARFFGLEKGSS